MENDRQRSKQALLQEKEEEKDSDPISLLQQKRDVTIRDDHFDFETILDAVRRFKDKKYRFRLIDTGNFGPCELEWITAQGADLYTTDEIRSSARELELINAASRKRNALLAYLITHRLEADAEEGRLSFFDLINLGRSGVYIHLTNRKNPQEPALMASLAYSCRKGGSWLVYYHQGPLQESLVEVADSGAWVHITDQSLEEEQSRSLVRDMVLSAQSSGANLVLHWEKGVPFILLEDLVKAGALVLFKSILFDYRSPFKILEKEIRKKRLDYRSYYLYPTVLP